MMTFTVFVPGRPAPQGSKEQGSAGQMREASKYLPAWRAAIKKAVYERYKVLGVKPADLPLMPGAVGIEIVVHQDLAPTSKPDADKLLRAILDALTIARLYIDDAYVVVVRVRKMRAVDGRTGADITVWQETLEDGNG